MWKQVVSGILTSVCVLGSIHCPWVAGEDEKRIDDAEEPQNLYAESAVLIDADSGRVLYGKHETDRKAMASTTKIMTCLLALELGDSEDIVTFSDTASKQPDVQLNAAEGEQYYLKDLLYSLMLESHNDTAVAIAEHIAGSVDEFAYLMNEKAAELGAYDTHFVTPNGLDAEEHYTTAVDLAHIAAYAIRNPEFCSIISTATYNLNELQGRRSVTLINRDAFLQTYDGAMGIKTGFTGNAGYCFVGAARREDKTLVSVVLASGWPPHKTYKWKDTVKMMDYGMENYEKRCLLDENYWLQDIPVIDGIHDQELSLMLELNQDWSLLLKDSDTVRYEECLPDCIDAPVVQGERIGSLKIYVNEEFYGETFLYAGENIERITYGYVFYETVCWFLHLE